MNCKEAEFQILLQESGEMGVRKEQALAVHLQACDACRQLQQAAVDAGAAFTAVDEPSLKSMQAVLREARLQAPEKKTFALFGLKPAFAAAACALLAAGLFFSPLNRDKVGMELVMAEAQLLEPAEQVASVMYSGLSEDDLAFNFLMTYDGS